MPFCKIKGMRLGAITDPSVYEEYYDHFMVFHNSANEHDALKIVPDGGSPTAVNEWLPSTDSLAVG